MRQTPTSPYVPDLDHLREWLEKMVSAMKLVELVIAIMSLITRMRDINLELTKRVAHLTRQRPRSETLERLERQLALPFTGLVARSGTATNGALAGGGPKEEEPKPPKTNHRPSTRNEFPAHLKRVPVPNPVPQDQRICPLCGAEMKTVGHSICERLSVIPAQIFIEQRVDETIACPKDDTIISALAPPAIVERGKLADTLIIEATSDKYIEHQPIERQCQRWQRTGVTIAPQTLARSVAAHIDLITPVARLIAEQTRAPGLLGTDATGIPILDPKVTDGIRTGAMWAWTNARWVTFFYSASGDSDSVRRFLGDDLCRTVQCDGTSVTTFIERAGGKRPGCMAHGRRRFVEAARAGDKIALEGLRRIAPLFAIERASSLAGDNAEQRRARRQQHSRPVLDELRAWLDEHRALVPPKTPLGRALGYLHRQWRRLILFLEDGNIELTNNRRERELRRLVLGRKNWLFTWLDLGGERTASILTIVATCIAHDIDPRAYLHLVTRLIVNGWSQKKLRELLPDRILSSHPELLAGDPTLLSPPDVPTLPAPA
jgi:transposase